MINNQQIMINSFLKDLKSLNCKQVFNNKCFYHYPKPTKGFDFVFCFIKEEKTLFRYQITRSRLQDYNVKCEFKNMRDLTYQKQSS